MFERFTERARRSLFFARYEAQVLGGSYVETEYLLLGLLREDKSLAKRFLPSDAAVAEIRRQIESHAAAGEKLPFTSAEFPLSYGCKRALAYAAEEAGDRHRSIAPEHMLLGLLREEESMAARLLSEQGLTLASVREALQRSLGQPASDES